VKSAVPGEIVDAGRGFKKDYWRTRGDRLTASHAARDRRNLEIIDPADQSAFKVLGEKFVEIHHLP